MRLTRIFFHILFLCAFGLKAQTLVSIHNTTVSISPGYTVTNATSFTVTGTVKNAGITTINNSVHVHLAIDTSTTTTPKYYLRSTRSYSVTNFLPGDVFLFSLSDVADNANHYKVAGNGTTVVIWTVVGFPINDTTTLDSAKTNLYILGSPVGIEERDVWEKQTIYIQNPVTDQLILRYDPEDYKKIDLTDSNGKTVGVIWNSESATVPQFTVNLRHLAHGMYYLRCYHDAGIITKKIIVY